MTTTFDPLAPGSVPQNITRASLESVISSYLTYYAASNSHTSRAKRLDAAHFLNYLATIRGVSDPAKLKVSDWDFSSVQRFVDECLRRGETPATVSRRLATLKHLGRTLAERLPGFVNPAREVRAPRADPIRPKGLSSEEVERVTDRAGERIAERDTFSRRRNLMLVQLLLQTGLRADEVRSLRFGQIDENLEWVLNVKTKGKKYRSVYLPSAIRKSFAIYLDMREKQLRKLYTTLNRQENRALPVFISLYNAKPGKPDTFLMGPKSVWRAVREVSVGKKLHPHLLRHSYALDLLEETKDVRLVSQALGHSDVRVTMRYTERRDEEIAAAVESLGKKRKKA